MRRFWVVCLVLIPVLCLQAQPQQKKPVPAPLEDGESIPLDQVIPANERGILCLADDDQGRIYGGTTGRAAHLFVYDPKAKQVRSLARLEGGIGFAYALIRLPDGSLIAGTQADPTGTAVATDEKAVGWLYRFTIEKDGTAKAEKLGKPVEGQGVYTLAFDKKRETIFGNTWPDGHFFTYDLKARKFTDHGAIAGYRPFESPREAEDLNRGVKEKVHYSRQVSRAIFVIPDRGAFTGGKDGQLFRYDFKTKKITKMEKSLPAAKGREPWASLDVAVVLETSSPSLKNRVYYRICCGTSDGYFFCIDDPESPFRHPFAADLQPVYRITSQGRFHGIVLHRPRGHERFIVTGVVGNSEGMPRVFSIDKSTLEMTVAGIPKVDGQLSMVGFGTTLEPMVGRYSYAGEQDRIARLVRYWVDDQNPQKQIKPNPPPAPPKNLLGPPPEENLHRLKCSVVFAPQGTTTDGSGYTALAVGLDGTVYVGSARYGGYAYLLRFDPRRQPTFMEIVVNVQQLVGEFLSGINTQGKIHAIIVIGPDGRVWFATKQAHEIFDTRPEYEDPDGYPGGHLCYYDPKTGFSRSVGILKKHEGLMGGVMDVARNKLFYRTEPKNILLSYDIATGKVKEHGHIGNACRYMVIDKDGAVYTPGRGNYLCRFDPQTGYIEDLAVKVEGPGYYEAPYVIALGPNGKLYGAGVSHPWIMEFDIANYKKGLFPEVTMRNVAPAAPRGLPVQDIHAGVFGKDGKFYYPLQTLGPAEPAGKAKRHLRIMRFDPTAGKTETVGIPDPQVDENKVKHVYVRKDAHYELDYIQGMKVGADGTLYVMDIYPQLNVAVFPQLTAPRK
jgi:hypothetical protein